MEEKPQKSDSERIRDLEQQVEVLAQQLQRTQRLVFLGKFLAENPGATLHGLANRHFPMPVPCGFMVTFNDGTNVSKKSLILGATPTNGVH